MGNRSKRPCDTGNVLRALADASDIDHHNVVPSGPLQLVRHRESKGLPINLARDWMVGATTPSIETSSNFFLIIVIILWSKLWQRPGGNNVGTRRAARRYQVSH